MFRLSIILVTLWLHPTMVHAGFTDTPGHTYEHAIDYVQSEGIVEGYSDGTFRPDQAINRAEFTKIMIEATFDPVESYACLDDFPNFAVPDVPAGAWFAKYVCTAWVNAGIVSGYPDGTFRPANLINYAEAAKIIVRAFGNDVAEGSAVWYQPFTDFIDRYNAKPPTVYSADQQLTRGEMAYIIHILKRADQQTNDRFVVPQGMYADFKEYVIGNGNESVLFFHASWCPYCQANHKRLMEWYESEDFHRSVYKVDYDSAKDLRYTYGITGQDTFILIDGDGVELRRVVSPDEWDLRDLLGE